MNNKKDDMRNLFSKIREYNSKLYLNEEGEETQTVDTQNKPIPINDSTFPGVEKQEQEKLNQKIPSVSFEENSFMYNPSNNTVTLTGTIQNLANLKFQYTTDTSTPDGGVFIFVNGLVLEQTSLQVLNTLKGYYDIWVNEWSPMETKNKLNINNKELNTMQNQ